MAEVVCVLDARAGLGEGPVANALYWVDIVAPAVHRFDPAAGADIAWPMPEPVGSLALAARGGLLSPWRPGWPGSIRRRAI